MCRRARAADMLEQAALTATGRREDVALHLWLQLRLLSCCTHRPHAHTVLAVVDQTAAATA
jgi:hypothetical protein